MGRGRGKGKKLTVSNHEDAGSGEEEKLPAQKRRGRPQKPLKDDNDEEEVEKIEDEDGDNEKAGTGNKDLKSPTATENGKKRKCNPQIKKKPVSIKEENGNGTRSSTDDSTKSNGFRIMEAGGKANLVGQLKQLLNASKAIVGYCNGSRIFTLPNKWQNRK